MPRPYRPIDPARVQQLAEGRAAARRHMLDLIDKARRELAAADEQTRAAALDRLLYHTFDLEALDAGVMQSEYLLRELTRLLRLGATVMASGDGVTVHRTDGGMYVCWAKAEPRDFIVAYRSPRHAAQAMASLTTQARIRVGIEAHRTAYPEHKPAAPAQQ